MHTTGLMVVLAITVMLNSWHRLQRATTGYSARDRYRHRGSGAQPHQAVN